MMHMSMSEDRRKERNGYNQEFNVQCSKFNFNMA